MFRLYSDLIAEMQGLEPEHFHVIRPVTKLSQNSYRIRAIFCTIKRLWNTVPWRQQPLRVQSACSRGGFYAGSGIHSRPDPGHSYQSVVH